MDDHTLLQIPLFNKVDPLLIQKLFHLNDLVPIHYKKNTLIAQEHDLCQHIGILISGSLSIQHTSPSGDLLHIKLFHSQDVFGAGLYQLNTPEYAFNLVTHEPTTIIYIPFSNVELLINQSPQFSKNYIALLAQRIHTLQDKIILLQYKDVRSRLLHYLTKECHKQQKSTFKLPHSKVDIANLIGVARPSVSRELKKMAHDHLIHLDGCIITLYDH